MLIGIIHSILTHERRRIQFILQLQTITDDREQQMNGLWSEFQSVLAVYLQHTEQQHDEYVQLRQRDEEDTRIVRFHYAEVLRSTNLIAELKHRLDLYETDQRVHVGELHRYKRILLERQAAAKSSVEEGSKRDREAMRWMVVKSDEAISVRDTLIVLIAIFFIQKFIINITDHSGSCRKRRQHFENWRNLPQTGNGA